MDQAHFPGGPGCEPIGTPCDPDDDWAPDLPAFGAIFYVKPGADPDVADGTREHPYATIGAAASRAGGNEAVIALSKGTYGPTRIGFPHVYWGACVAETVIEDPEPAAGAIATLSIPGVGATVRNLQVRGGPHVVYVSTSSGRPTTMQSVLLVQSRDRSVLRVEDPLVARELVIRSGPELRQEARALAGVVAVSSNLGHDVEVELERSVIERVTGVGIQLGNERASLVARDLALVAIPAPGETRWFGGGLAVQWGSHARLERVAFHGVRTIGVSVEDDSVLEATDFVVDTTEPRSDGSFGIGLQVVDGGIVNLDRASFVSAGSAGLVVTHGELRATDVSIRDTLGDGRGNFGFAVNANEAGTVVLDRFHAETSRTTAILLHGAEVVLSATDVTVAETGSRPHDGEAGEGLSLSAGAHADLVRASFDLDRRFGVVGFHDGTEATLEDLLVTSTLQAECAAEECTDTGGCGLAVFAGATTEATRFRVSGNALCGVRVVDAALDLHEGLVARNPIGANVEAEGFDLRRLQDRVLYRDNVRNLDAASLPAPAPMESLTAFSLR